MEWHVSQQGYIDGIKELTIQNKNAHKKEFREPCRINSTGCQANKDQILLIMLNKATVEEFIYAKKVIREMKIQPVTINHGGIVIFLKKKASRFLQFNRHPEKWHFFCMNIY